MPFTDHDGVRLHWKIEGVEGGPAVLLLGPLGTDLDLWDAVVRRLSPHARVLRIDLRGHGESDAPGGDYSLALLGGDVAACMDAAGVHRALVAGVGLGGMVGLQLAAGAPGRVSGLVVLGALVETEADEWRRRIAAALGGDLPGLARREMARSVSRSFAAARPAVVARLEATMAAMSPAGYAGAAAAIRDATPGLADLALDCPLLVIDATRDSTAPFEDNGALIAAATPGARIRRMETGLLAPVECPGPFADAVLGLAPPSPEAQAAEQVLYEAGLANRRRVLGDEWVDGALARRTPFNADFQEMMTRIAWYEIYKRPGLETATRRMLVLVITAAQARWEEYRLHLRAAVTVGAIPRDDIKEVLMQLAIYAGVPCANTAFSEAASVFQELDRVAAP